MLFTPTVNTFSVWGSRYREAIRAVNALMAEANTELTAHGTALAGDSWRSYQEALRTRSTKRTTIRPSYNQQPVRSRSDNPVTTKTCGAPSSWRAFSLRYSNPTRASV